MMKLFIVLICLFGMLSLSNSKCLITNAPAIELNKDAVVCLHIYKDSLYDKTFAFRVNVDYFEALVINKFAAYINALSTTVNQINVTAEFQNTDGKSQTIEIYNKNAQRYRDILSFIIIIQEGLFTEIRLDNAGCDNLGGTDICYLDQSYTKTANKMYGLIDPKFYISWMGSDVNKNHCISHTRRLSRFSQFSVGSIYNSAKSIASI